MLISHAGSRPAQRKGSADSPAMESLVPGDFRQTEEDLAAFPQPVLDLLSRYGTRVAILADGQTLADSPGLRTMTEQEVATEAKATNSIVTAGVSNAFAKGIESLEQLETVADGLTRELRAQGIDNSLGLALSPFSLEALAEARQIPADKTDQWKAAFESLNAGLVEVGDQGVSAKLGGIVVFPHTYYKGQAIPESRLRNAGQVTASYVQESLGLNRSEDRLVLLHEKFLTAPSAELGNYKLAIHEMGHALDHALEHLTNFPGFGPLHRQTLDALYEADLSKVASGAQVSDVFTSDRADDDVREYFAEAVEAYLTPENANGHDTFRAGNSTQGLASKNSALYGYVEKIMTTNFAASALPELPKRTFAPPGFPDPDLQVVRIS